MLLERNQVLVGVVFGALLIVGSIFAIVWSDEVFGGGTDVVVELGNSEGLEPGATVLVAGLRAGDVRSVSLAGDLVEVTVRVKTPLPRDSRAEVILQNLVGKRALQFTAGEDWDHLLEEMDEPRVPVERTSGLVDVPELNDATVALLQDADTEAIRALITSLADLTAGQRDEVARLLSGLRQVSAVLEDRREALSQLLERAHVVTDAAADRSDELVAIVDGFGSTLDTLAGRRDDIRRLLDETAGATAVTADLLESERDRIDRVLDEVHAVLAIADRHQVDIAHSMAYGGVAFYGFSEVGRSGEADNPYWANILTTGIGEAGIDAFAGCGGVVDEFLDTIFGEAECPEEAEDRDADGAAAAAPSDVGGLLRRAVP